MKQQDCRDRLRHEYERIKANHQKALRRTAARVVLGASVVRVFRPGTKGDLLKALEAIDIEGLRGLTSHRQFTKWFETELHALAAAIRRKNRDNARINPGYKWGHATKILTLYVRDLVLSSRYFADGQVRRVSGWLYSPIDSVVIKRLRCLGLRLPFASIKQIDTRHKYYDVQEMLHRAAARVGVPRVWFDDNWGDHQ